MTNNDAPRPTRPLRDREIAARTKFVMPEGKVDTSRNFSRTSPRSSGRRKSIR